LSKNDIYANIGEIVTGRKRGRPKKEEITIFDFTGLAIQNITIANLYIEKLWNLKRADT